MFKSIIKAIGGDPNEKVIAAYAEKAEEINQLEAAFEALTEEELAGKTAEFRGRLDNGETLDDILFEAFAAVREVSKRVLGMRHYDVQLIGGMILHDGQVAEMRTGEGKTLMSTLPIYLNALTGKGVHLITVNDYLARRDARWMAPIFHYLGLSVGVLQMATRTENGKMAFIIDFELDHPQEDQRHLNMVIRKEAYNADILYGTNSEFGFDYLRDNMTLSLDARSQNIHHYAIIDEVDNVLIDEARTPLIISGPSHDDAENYQKMTVVVKQLQPEDYEVEEKDRTVTLSEIGMIHVEQLLGVSLQDPERPEDITPEQARLLGYLEQALRAQHLYKRNKDYIVQSTKVVIVDTFTGRLMPGRRWSDGLHQAVEAKEGVKVEAENVTHATITIQNYFRMYTKLSGMTGTALTEAEEFADIYKLEVLAIPPNVEYNANHPDSPLIELKAKDEHNYEYTYYARRDDDEQLPAMWKRKDYPDMVFRTVEAKVRATVQEIIQIQVMGRPILLGTTSVDNSEMLSTRLKTQWVRKLVQTLLIRTIWMEQNDRMEDGRLIMALQYLYEPLDKLNTTQMNKMAKELGMNLNPEDPANVQRLLTIFDLKPEHQPRLLGVLQNGVSHQVLNARKHTEESQIIAGAGAFGAVTIATNMAGRGVDIKLGGEVAEEILSAVNRVLKRSGVNDPYVMTMEERLTAVNTLSADDYGLYSTEIKFFIQGMGDMEKVKELGGLHVIGSERHDARRIDNQLRGRAARQGDPGSSRFYLSLQDDLMRLFGGQQVEGMMEKLGMDDALPLEHGIVSRVVEQSQTRVEGANFDTRKHLLEYDDVLNAQRMTIYDQRDRIFVKDDLSEDLDAMLIREVEDHIAVAAGDDEGAWKLLAWLEQIQSTRMMENIFIPSFMYTLLLNPLKDSLADKETIRAGFLEIAAGALDAEEAHIRRSTEMLLDTNALWLEDQLEEREEILETFIEALGYEDETDTRSPKELFNEAQVLMRVPLQMTTKEHRLLRDDPEQAEEILSGQLEQVLTQQAVTRLLGAVDNRLNMETGLNARDLATEEWKTIEATVLENIQQNFAERRVTLLDNGKITQELNEVIDRVEGDLHYGHLLQLLINMQQGRRIGFDVKTKRQVERRFIRFRYFYYAAERLGKLKPEKLQEDILSHLDQALVDLKNAWGMIATRNRSTPLGMQPKPLRDRLSAELGEDTFAKIKAAAPDTLPAEQLSAISKTVGNYELTEIHRQIMLRAISELWIEYLTSMEALRVSIGLEAYGQRDPLVQYKAKASQMFQELIRDVRASVVNRMFNLKPRSSKPPQAAPQASIRQTAQGGKQGNKEDKKKTKRKRKRR